MLLSHHRGPGFPTLLHLPHLTERERAERYGTGTFDPVESLPVGAYGTITFTFEIGACGVAAGGRLGICWRWPYDWCDLQEHDPAADGFVRVQVEGRDDVRLEPTYEPKGGVEPWHHVVAARVVQGALVAGDRVWIVCGDRTGGGRGWRAPSCASPAMGFLMMIDPDGDPEDGGVRWLRLGDPPAIALTAGPLHRLILVAPSQAVVGHSASVLVRGEDRWGNPARLPDPEADGGPGEPRVNVTRIDLGGAGRGSGVEVLDPAYESRTPTSFRLPITLDRPGAFEIRIEMPSRGPDRSLVVARSNPIIVGHELPSPRLYWGDLHAGQCETGCGMGSVSDHYAYARETAGIQFATEQSNDHYLTRDAWNHLRREAESAYDPGAFVTFVGCEWSPETPAGGDRNVFYRHDEPRLRRSGRYFLEAEPDPEPDIPTAPDFHRAFGEREVLVNIHVGGRMTNLTWHDGRIERLAEIHSTHGTIEWFIEDVLCRGYRVGITAGTDGVMARPGADQPGHGLIRNLPNGLTAVYAAELTRDGLWQAFEDRRCYATTGERIVLAMDVDGHPMGSDHETTGHPTVSLDVTGTAPLREAVIFRGVTPIHVWEAPAAPATGADERWIEVLWRGTGARGTAGAQRLTWDGTLRVDGGTILDAQPVGHFAPDGGLSLEDATTLSWTSATAGNEAGALVRVRGGPDASARFSSGPCTFEFRLGDVSTAPVVVDAGGVNRRVTVAPAPAGDAPRRLRLTFTDTDAVAGAFPYWVRVTQVDRAKAWSTPVYVARG